MKYFVWYETYVGPQAQIIYDELPKSGEGKTKPFLACHAIPDNDMRSIEDLKRDFKLEAKS